MNLFNPFQKKKQFIKNPENIPEYELKDFPIEDKEKQVIVANRILDEKLSVRETEKLVKSLLEGKEKKKKETKKDENAVFYKDLEEKIKEIVGTKVSIQHKSKDKGKIEIEYYSEEELERIIELLMSVSN